MGNALKNTSWPFVVISDDVKCLIAKFFAIVDLPDPNSGNKLAEEIFTEFGVMAAATGKSIGFEAISKSRERAWEVIKSRRHEVIKVYASDAEGQDLMLIGKVVAVAGSGKEAEVSFTARIIIEWTISGLRIKLYEVWSDQTPLKNLVERE